MEVDRRVVRKRIQTLRRRIEQMARTRRTQRARRLRAGVPLIALAGYTNAGKSTLLNALTDAEVSVRDRLFETLDPTSRSYRYRDRDYVLTDTVGFIRKLPHQLVDAFASTLEETTLADVVLVVADASLEAPEIAVREQTVADVLDMIGSTAPRIVVFNKIDRVDEPQAAAPAGALPGGRVHRRRQAATASRRSRSVSAASSTARCGRCACSSRTPRPARCTVCAASPATCARSTRPRAWSSRPGCPWPRPGATRATASSPRRLRRTTPPLRWRRPKTGARRPAPMPDAGLPVPVRLLTPAARLPERAYEHDAA